MGYYKTAVLLNVNTMAGGKLLPGTGNFALWEMRHGLGGIDDKIQEVQTDYNAYVGSLRW